MSNKSAELIPLIIEAKTKEDAVKILTTTLEILHLSTSYTEMVRLRDRLNHYQSEFKRLTAGLDTEGVIIEYQALNESRMSLGFLFRDIQDELSAPINSNKIYYEEVKTVRRAEGMQELKGSEVAKDFKATSASSLRDLVGASETYAKYSAEYSIAYGNYKTLENLLNSIRLVLDAIASREKHELIILQKEN